MKRLFIFTFLLVTLFLRAQAGSDLDDESLDPLKQMQKELIQEELKKKPKAQQTNVRQTAAKNNIDQKAESDTDTRIPQPVFLQQRERILKQLEKKPKVQETNLQKAAAKNNIDQKAESDTDTRIPQPVFLQQRERILKQLEDYPGELAITAEVKAKWKTQYKRNDGHGTRGVHAVVPVSVPTALILTTEGAPMKNAPSNKYTSEANVYLDYETCRNWVEVKFQFKNDLGIESGTNNKIALQKGWIGYDFFDDEWGDFDAEIGRKPASEIFDSRLQFDSVFDGALITWRRRWQATGEFFIHGGPMLMDAKTTQIAVLMEGGLEEAFDTGGYAKVSLAWWKHAGADRYNVYNSPKYRYINPQILLGYDFKRETIGIPLKVYGSFIYNCAAEANVSSAGKKRPVAWYAAIQFGKLKKCGDMFFDICYQSVGAQSIPSFDNAGIGRGNSTSWGDLPVIADPTDPANFTNPQDVLTLPADQVQGNANYQGIEVRFYYNVTDQLIFKATGDFSQQKTRAVGGGNTNRTGELQLIYQF